MSDDTKPTNQPNIYIYIHYTIVCKAEPRHPHTYPPTSHRPKHFLFSHSKPARATAEKKTKTLRSKKKNKLKLPSNSEESRIGQLSIENNFKKKRKNSVN
jgi:hypothetical protein